MAQKVGAGSAHVWLVWMSMYQTYGVKCKTIASDLLSTATNSSSSTIMTAASYDHGPSTPPRDPDPPQAASLHPALRKGSAGPSPSSWVTPEETPVVIVGAGPGV